MPFTGHAVYDTGVYSGIAESVQDLITDISPRETRFLDAIGDSDRPATHVNHEWLEDALAPNRLTIGSNVASTESDTSITVGGLARFIQAGTILSAQGDKILANETAPEYLRVASIVNDTTIFCQRGFANTKVSTHAQSSYLIVQSQAVLDGRDVSTDSSRPRTRVNNYTQIFMEDVIISGTSESMDYLGGITSEQDHQIAKKLKEAMLKLERTVLLGRAQPASVGTIGSSSVVRTMRGVLNFIDQTAANVKTFNNSAASPVADFEQALLDTIEVGWQNGGTDLDLIVCGAKLKRSLDQLNTARIRVTNVESRYGNNVYEYECAYGIFTIQLNRWMHGNMAAVVATPRIKVVPLQKRSFTYVPVAKTGDSEKGMILGEYTVEVRNPTGMCAAIFPNLGTVYTP